MPSERHLSDMLVQWGQFLAHDTDHSSTMPPQQPEMVQGDVTIPISVPNVGDLSLLVLVIFMIF